MSTVDLFALNTRVAHEVFNGWPPHKWRESTSETICDYCGTESWEVEANNPCTAWNPAGDIGQAWEIVERLRHLGYTVDLRNLGHDQPWYCFIRSAIGTYIGHMDTASAAICEAVLRLKEGSTPGWRLEW